MSDSVVCDLKQAPARVPIRPDLFLLLSLLVVILSYPALDHDNLQKLVLSVLLFVPVVTATVRTSQLKGWIWPSSVLMAMAIAFTTMSTLSSDAVWGAIKWWSMAAFFAVTVAGLFSSFIQTPTVTKAHLLTAVSIYLLIGMLFFAVYSAIETMHPGSIRHSSSALVDRPNELLYFSLVTLATIGYGDIVPVAGEARMLAALEGMAGVLYIAITVALLVSAYGHTE